MLERQRSVLQEKASLKRRSLFYSLFIEKIMMANSLLNTVGYKEKIIDISLPRIEVNPLNPRKRFVDTEEDALIESILTKGLLNPIIVYKRKSDNQYVILDGERRYRAFKKLNKKLISCHILEKEPTQLENLSMMFHIHNVREEWTEFAIAQTIVLIVTEMGKNVRSLDRQDKLELVQLTSLTEYRINKYLSFYDYPQKVIQKFMESEMRETPIKGMDPDILAEMHGPLKMIKSEVPAFLKSYNEEKIIDACVRKKAHGIIKTNREFRDISKSLKAVKTGRIRSTVMFEKLQNFVENLDVTPRDIFEDTAETLFQVESIIKLTDNLIKDVQNLDLKLLTKVERVRISIRLEKLAEVISIKLPHG